MTPFLLIPQTIVNPEQKEKIVETRIQPGEICNYYPGFYTGTIIVLKSGGSLFTELSAEQLDALLEAYHREVKSKAGKFGILSLSIKPKNQLHAAN